MPAGYVDGAYLPGLGKEDWRRDLLGHHPDFTCVEEATIQRERPGRDVFQEKETVVHFESPDDKANPRNVSLCRIRFHYVI